MTNQTPASNSRQQKLKQLNEQREAVKAVFAGNKRCGLYCRASWHLRSNPRAVAIYDLAIAVTKGGETDFHASIRQVADYFGWSTKSVFNAFRLCEESGLFVRVRTGSGGRLGQEGFANEYEVVLHEELNKKRHPCCQDVKKTRGKKEHSKGAPVVENTTPCSRKEHTPVVENTTAPVVENTTQSSVFSLLKESTEGVYEPKSAPALSQTQNQPLEQEEEQENLMHDLAIQQLVDDERAIIESIPEPVIELTNNMTPLSCPLDTGDYPNSDPLILPYTEPTGYLSEASTAENYDRCCTALSFTNDPARVFLDYDATSELDRLYGHGSSVTLAEKIAEHCPKHRSFIYSHLSTVLRKEVEV